MEENLKQLSADIIKIAIVGPECTGKTTLARQLAERFNTVWIPEFARDYLQKKWDFSKEICAPEDMLPIVQGQIAAENEALEKAIDLIITDTSSIQSKVYSDIYYRLSDPAIEKAARKHKYDLFFLTDIDVPWEKDDLRDHPNDRQADFEIFRNELIKHDKPYIILSGSAEERLQKATVIIDALKHAKQLGLTSQDFLQIRDHNVTLKSIENQIAFFKNGIAKADLDRPAIVGDGIVRFTQDEFTTLSKQFDKLIKGKTLGKFVPASGAASRMFKFLNEFMNEFDVQNESINAYVNRKNASDLRIFLAGLEKFPFYPKIWKKLRESFSDFEHWDRATKVYHFIRYMLEPQYFNFCDRPKGVLPFHKYKGHVATPVEEHLQEAVHYSSSEGKAKIHFTVSEDHRKLFEEVIAKIKPGIERESGKTIDVDFSFQDKSTDTIAVGLENAPFRNKHNRLVFRPGGHGALINNLSQIDSDIIFIKNIDNVIQDHVQTIAFYKKALGSVLISLQNEIFSILKRIDDKSVRDSEISEIISFAKNKLNIEIIEDFEKYTASNKIDYIRQMLNRPLRVCGMVKNEGEPGGGPFWVRDKKGIPRLQIVETSQVDMQNPTQAEIVKKSTHFNPVDIICSIKNYLGEKFNLNDYVDHNSGFIVEKNKDGKPLKAYELPGLWNGAMAKWITVFVEEPLITFNPVKTVNDLLKPEHQENGLRENTI